MRVGSLFAGIGGFDLAAEWAGWETAWYSEIDPYASAVMRKHFPRAVNHGDITKIDGRTIERVDVLCGGFPCQDISLAGKGEGLGGARSGLWSHYRRLVEEIRPSWVVIENVSALRSRGLDRVLGELAALGYDAEWHCIPAAYVGAPHRRDRVWVVAWCADANGERLAQRAQRDGAAIGPVIEASLGNDADGLRDAVADAHSESGNEGWTCDAAEVAGRRDVDRSSVSEDVANTAGDGCTPGEAGRSQCVLRGPQTRDATQLGGWWLTEPDVGRSIDGLSAWLDGVGDGEQRAREMLQGLRRADVAEALWRTLRGLDGFSAEEVLLAVVREYESGRGVSRQFVESPDLLGAYLRALWGDEFTSGASCRSGPIEQHCREHPDALRELSCLVAPRGASPWDNALWESTIPRVAANMPARVDRLRCLGNAIVPQVAYLIFQAIQQAASGINHA